MASFIWKFVIGGDGGVGKTTFLIRYVKGCFSANTMLTVGVQIHNKELQFNGAREQIVFWDLGGQDRFRFLLPSYCDGARAGIVVFSMTDTETLERAGEWVSMFKARLPPGSPIILVGTKLDLIKDPATVDAVNREANEFVTAKGCARYFPSSSASGTGINDVIEFLLGTLHASLDGADIRPPAASAVAGDQ